MRSVWAVARNTIAQAIRMKAAAIVIVLLIILLPMMSVIMVGDNTLKGKLQTFVSYGLGLTSFLLCFLTIAMAVYSLTSDLKGKEIYLVVTKPIYRFQIFCGKLLGVIVLDILLLAVFSVIIYALTVSIPRFSGAGEEEIAKVQKEFFTARVSLTDPIDEKEIEKKAQKEYEKRKKSRQLPTDMSEKVYLMQLKSEEMGKAKAVVPGGKRIWEFEDIKPYKDNKVLFVRYKYETASSSMDSKVYGMWDVGDLRQEQFGPGQQVTPIYRVGRAEVAQAVHEFEIPINAISPDGYLSLVFRNNPNLNYTTIIPEEVEVLLKADSFASNYVRVVLMILVRLVFLAALGVSLSTWLSFPVAILVCMVVFFAGSINGFIIESFGVVETSGGRVFYDVLIRPLLWLLPRFDGEFNPTRFMVSAELLNWAFLGRVFAITIAVKALLLSLFGMWIFSNREIAKISI